MKRGLFDVVGIGNAVVDVIANVEEDLLPQFGLRKGVMTLIEAARAEELHAALPGGREVSGGSAANTMAGLASLGGRAAYIGRVRDDRLGAVFAHDLGAAGVTYATPPSSTGPPTGRCLVLVTPDAERTMQTCLGASVELGPEDVDADLVASAAITYLEGYLFDKAPAKQAFRLACAQAHRAGGRVALSLSDTFCVERHRTDFRELVSEEVDLLFANEDEIMTLYEAGEPDSALDLLTAECETAVITMGERGSLVATGEHRIEVEAVVVDRVVDTTGAGDLYAAGFLYGVTSGYPAGQAGRIGALAAAEVISHLGARPERSLSELVRQRIGTAGTGPGREDP